MILALSSLFLYPFLAVLGFWGLGLGLYFLLKHRAERQLREAEHPDSLTSEELLDELRHGFIQRRKVTVRTHTEYLPFLIERIRETIDRGLGDDQVQSLLERIDLHKPGTHQKAMFPIECDGISSDLMLEWIRDSADRIELTIWAMRPVAKAVKKFAAGIPRAIPNRDAANRLQD
ncbi:hypothetical protein HNR46_002424 [Haloferula luteola]|uniref:Uncharacterized protein n=1 Tax=Haloferula luteola TaxID=595692 RepID=A0A840VHF0_9BACT|nr:hypothetical protein [Haloferula luteola]MBB5352181.1 hypothetical protein [Haloferula luteola]